MEILTLVSIHFISLSLSLSLSLSFSPFPSPPTLQIQSCFAVDHYCDTDVCNLRESPNKDVYSCCCKGNLCNTNINYPDLNASTEQPPLLLTTTTMSATVNATTVTTEHGKLVMLHWGSLLEGEGREEGGRRERVRGDMEGVRSEDGRGMKW